MKKLIKQLMPCVDVFFVPLVFISAWVLKIVRKAGIRKFPLCKNTLLGVGVFPLVNHYYDPQFDFRNNKHLFSTERNLPGINWNIQGQLNTLKEFVFSSELENIPTNKPISEQPCFLWLMKHLSQEMPSIGINLSGQKNQKKYLKLAAATPLSWQ